jgi:hypothetical protein
MSTQPAGAPTGTILFTDFVDATTLRAELGEAGMLRKYDGSRKRQRSGASSVEYAPQG